MLVTHKTIVWMMTILFAAAGICAADTTFRGIPLDQGNNVSSSNVLDRMTDFQTPFYIDILDNFERSGELNGSDADSLQVGFVAPVAGLPDGYLQGQHALDHGRWTASDYATNGSGVQRITGAGVAVASTPWRANGYHYLLEMTAQVAAGETVTLGYLGDIATSGASDLLASSLGQLVLGMTRGIGADQDNLDWVIAWDDSGIRKTAQGVTTVPAGQEIDMQLGWFDSGSANNDAFDVWLGTDGGNERLLRDSMGNAIEVYAVGFDMNGVNSTIGSFAALVPEPATGMLAIIGLLGMYAAGRRQTA